ncbi:hypothetical protein DICVIV_03194 [Dictyocaulus viviparus]|uniref:Squalene/phytoene synthase n=1 Tax=Dictyocaulus viviparus TaxID=29172 RepID=A0A0D8Y3W0_DICVI|nr:hypothetical protein DICVIV_03194 [Dictyocaulus viviparus]
MHFPSYSSFRNYTSCLLFYQKPSSSNPDFSNLPGARVPKTTLSKRTRLLEITPKNAQDAFEHCLQLVKSRDRENYQSSLVMPQACRAEILALLAFNIEVALIREKISSQRGSDIAGMYRLQFWRDAIKSIYGDSVSPVPRQPIAIALCSFAPQASLSLLESLIIARQQTMGDRPFRAVDDVAKYGVATAGALIRLEGEALARGCLLGKPCEAFVDAAHEMGAAYSIMNLIRSFLPLLAKGIILLPADLLELHNLTPDRVYKRKDSAAVTNLVRDMTQASFSDQLILQHGWWYRKIYVLRFTQVALVHIQASRKLSSLVPRPLRSCLAASGSVVDTIVNSVKKVDYNIYDPILQKSHPFLIWSLLLKKILGRY